MIEDRELDTWREQWGNAAQPLPELRHLQQRIRHHRLRFIFSNVLAAIAFASSLVFAVFVQRKQTRMGTGWMAGICIFMLVTAGYRVWVQRGSWRTETQSTCAFLELWHRRVTARIRSLRMAFYLVPGWLVVCAALALANWSTIGPDFKAHPVEWLTPLVLSLFVLPIIFFWMSWYRRRKMAELNEVEKLLAAMKGYID